jgi:hypothetical protein
MILMNNDPGKGNYNDVLHSPSAITIEYIPSIALEAFAKPLR